MSHARIEEVSDSDPDSDPSEGDISDLDDREILRQRAPPQAPSKSAPAPSSHAPRQNLINPSHIPSGNFLTTDDEKRFKDHQCIYPVYFDITRSRKEGRMVSKELAVENPMAWDIATACGRLGLAPLFEVRCHPKDWANPGRVKVKLKDGKNPNIKNKHHLYTLISKYLKANPTTVQSAYAARVGGMPPPDPKKEYQPPAVPKGWKLGSIVPYYSPALHGDGVSDNLMKEMMEQLAAGGGGMPGGGAGMPDMSMLQNMMGSMGGMGGAGPSGSAGAIGGGGGPKKKDKKRK